MTANPGSYKIPTVSDTPANLRMSLLVDNSSRNEFHKTFVCSSRFVVINSRLCRSGLPGLNDYIKPQLLTQYAVCISQK